MACSCWILGTVGACGFEPQTSRTRTVRATKLRYAPNAWDYTADQAFDKRLWFLPFFGVSRSLPPSPGAVSER